MDLFTGVMEKLISVMRRYRTNVSYSVTESLTLRTELTDVTLAIDDTLGDNVRGGDWGDGHVG